MRGTLRPRRQFHVGHFRPIVPMPKINPQMIHEELPGLIRAVKLGNELLEIRHVIQAVLVDVCDAIEHPIRVIEAAVLQTEHVVRMGSN